MVYDGSVIFSQSWIRIGYQIQSSWREIFYRAKTSTNKTDGRKVSQKIHAKIIRRLNTRPKLANPWRGDFQRDMPQEVFECLSKDLMQRTSFGQRFRETNTQVVYEITDMPKAKYLFTRMDLDRTEVDPAVILKREMSPVKNSLERCEVLVTNEKPMELLQLKFHYRYWNPSGVPQH